MNTQEASLERFRKMVSDLVRWHSPLPEEKHEKLVSDIMLHVPTLIEGFSKVKVDGKERYE